MKNSTIRALTLGCCGLTALTWAAGASAQTVAPATAVPTDPSLSGAPGEIIVTAQKRAQNLQDVPISIAVVSGERLAAFHSKDMEDIAASVPNLYVERLPAADVIYIRGFGSSPSNFAFDQSVSLYQDGIYSGRGKQFESPFFDIERVEVLRGPQGALFGKNTPAGAISIVTAGPTATVQGGATASYDASLHGYETSGYLSGPIGDGFSGRIAGKLLHDHGYIKNVNTGQNDPHRMQGVVRGTLRYAPNDVFDATLKLEYAHTHNLGAPIVDASATDSSDVRHTRGADGHPFGFTEGENITSKNASITANYKLGDHTLTSVTGYSTYDANRTNAYVDDVPAVYLNRILENFKQASEELRLASPTHQFFEYVVGGYTDWSKYNLNYPQYYNLSFAQGAINSHFRQRAETYSAFGQGTLNFTKTLRLVGSVRYTRTDKTGHFDTVLQYGQPFGALTTANGKIGESNVDPSATLQYDIAQHVMLYATYGRGSKSGGFVSNTVGTTSDTFTFKPEKSTNYEVGVKASLFDHAVTIDVSAFHLRFKDLQTSTYDPTASPPSFLTQNAAAATSKGLEWSVGWRAAQNLRISWNGGYLKAKYNNFPGANCLARQALSVCDPTAPLGAPNNVANNNLAGYPLNFVSKWSGSIDAQHTLPLGAYKLMSTAQLNYRSRYYVSEDQSPIYGIQKGYAKIDLRFQFGDASDRWDVALVGRNLTNKRTYVYSFIWPAALTNNGPEVQKYLDETRSIAIEAGVRF
jgi:iron complex outermembrane receptor protein